MSMLCKCLVKKLGCNENTFIATRENINKTVITIAYSQRDKSYCLEDTNNLNLNFKKIEKILLKRQEVA